MAGFLYRHTLVFDGPGHGWSESMYFERPTRDLDAAFAFVDDVKNKRAKLLGREFSVKGERITLAKLDTGAKVTREGFARRRFVQGVQAQLGEDTGTSLLVKWISSDGTRQKLMFMGGPYAALFPFANAIDRNAGQWETNFGSWRSLMRQLHMGWLHRKKNEQATISGYTFSNVTGHVTYTLDGDGIIDTPLGQPIPVNVEFPLSRSPLDGPQLVVFQDPNTCVTAGPRPAKPFTIAGQMKTFVTEFVDIGVLNAQGNPGNIFEERPVGRKRGRPLLESPGRVRRANRW